MLLRAFQNCATVPKPKTGVDKAKEIVKLVLVSLKITTEDLVPTAEQIIGIDINSR